ncbi:ETX/MTX2 family pore-forming toxin [Francisella frigiditurris]|uniref:Aerolysin toxin family protein n=1 Tax=Francisella frigiditurris TaxID=1542390 RepID=A0A1J0KSI8_9GAMM|nr:ETX/MTX2 family pore-forming toxin [Francisella frigiditurris]APC96725.1 aerolysin toxin family protein [Francisella frigiditurris]
MNKFGYVGNAMLSSINRYYEIVNLTNNNTVKLNRLSSVEDGIKGIDVIKNYLTNGLTYEVVIQMLQIKPETLELWKGREVEIYGQSIFDWLIDTLTPTFISNNDLKLSDDKSIYAGFSELNNPTDTPTLLLTDGFEHTETNTTSTTTTSGWENSTGVTTKAEFSIPFIGKGGVEITVSGTWSGSTSDTVTHSETISYISPPQRITVNPWERAELIVYLHKVQIDGTYHFSIPLTGTLRYDYQARDKNTGEILIDPKYTSYQSVQIPIFDALGWTQTKLPLPEGVKIDIEKRVAYLIGTGNVHADTGSHFSVTIHRYDIKTNKLVSTESYPINSSIISELIKR